MKPSGETSGRPVVETTSLGPFWPRTLRQALLEGPAVLVTVVSVKGSAPRAAGSKMIITRRAQYGSIGGGNLEYQASGTAHNMLATAQAVQPPENRLYGLGPALQQCCGGAVSVLYEYLDSPVAGWLEELCAMQAGQAMSLQSLLAGASVLKRTLQIEPVSPGVSGPALPCVVELEQGGFLLERVEFEQVKLAIFGAGHVASALVPILSQHAFDLCWIDNRPEQFGPVAFPGVQTVVSATPEAEVAGFAPGTLYLVMTHSHELDEDICYQVLKRNDAGWLGLIGSGSKRRRFEHRLRQRGLDETQLRQLTCPVGMAGITGKRPATIALSICAQLLQEQVPADWR